MGHVQDQGFDWSIRPRCHVLCGLYNHTRLHKRLYTSRSVLSSFLYSYLSTSHPEPSWPPNVAPDAPIRSLYLPSLKIPRTHRAKVLVPVPLAAREMLKVVRGKRYSRSILTSLRRDPQSPVPSLRALLRFLCFNYDPKRPQNISLHPNRVCKLCCLSLHLHHLPSNPRASFQPNNEDIYRVSMRPWRRCKWRPASAVGSGGLRWI